MQLARREHVGVLKNYTNGLMNLQRDMGLTIRKRHHLGNRKRNYIKRYWDTKGECMGEKAVIEWIFHIALDNLSTAFKISSKESSYGDKTYNFMEFGLSNSGFIHTNFKRIDESELTLIFKNKLIP